MHRKRCLLFQTTSALRGSLLWGKSTLAMVTVIAVALISPAAFARETHVVTASGYVWAYRDLRSGVGERNRVEIEAEPGDRVIFRQTDGEHGVVFYRNRTGTSELGKQVNVAEGFRVVGTTELEPASVSRVFSQKNLATPLVQGAGTLVTIELTDEFTRPIYFADANRSSRGQNRMFGAILRRSEAAVSETPRNGESSINRAAQMQEVGRHAWEESRTLPELLPGQQIDFRVPTREQADSLREANDDDINRRWPLKQWFSGDAVTALSPFNPENDWLFATTGDLDGDDDRDVIALIAQDENSPVWWGLLSGRRRRPESFEETRDWLNHALQPRKDEFYAAVRIADAPAEGNWKRASAATIDFDQDMNSDVVFSYGDSRIHFARQHPSFGGASMSFSARKSIDTALQFGIETVVAYYVDTLNSDDRPDLLVYGEQHAAEFFNRPDRGFASTDGRQIEYPGFEPVRAGRSTKTINGWRSLLLEDSNGKVHEYQKFDRGTYKYQQSGDAR